MHLRVLQQILVYSTAFGIFLQSVQLQMTNLDRLKSAS